jgi:TRAP-type C4-dicarboxylate transport system permease small subunit
MLGMSAAVFFRSVSGFQIPGITEASELVLIAGVYAGMAWTYHTGSHVNVDLVTQLLKPKAKAVVALVATILLFLVLVWMFLATSGLALESFQRGEYRFGVTQFPVWPSRIAISVGLLVFAVDVALHLFDQVKAIGRGEQVPPLGPKGSNQSEF